MDDWGEVVTRYPYRKVGMDHLLSKEEKVIVSECLVNHFTKYVLSFCLVLEEFLPSIDDL